LNVAPREVDTFPLPTDSALLKDKPEPIVLKTPPLLTDTENNPPDFPYLYFGCLNDFPPVIVTFPVDVPLP